MGEFEFKIILSPKEYTDGRYSELSIIDSDRKYIESNLYIWGRKVNCRFKIDENVSDGVALAAIKLVSDSGKETNFNLNYWIIK